MIDPAMELNAQVVLWDLTGKMLKVIKLYNAYCVNLEGHFDATGRGQQAGGSLRHSLRISPQAVAINGQFHDNDWPGPSPIVDWDWSEMNQQCNPDAKARQELLVPAALELPSLPTAKGMTDEEDHRPVNPGRTPDYPSTDDNRPFNPGRTPDYPSADKPSLPTIADRVEQIKKVAEWLFKDSGEGGEKRKKGEHTYDYEEVEIVNQRGEVIGEFDGIDSTNKVFIEDKSAEGLDRVNPKTGKPSQTPEEWATRQILNKTNVRITNLEKATGTRPTKGGSSDVPSIDEIKDYRKIHFEIDSTDPKVKKAVDEAISELKKQHPDWEFSANFGK